MGRFINADAFASTGQGVLGNNMFAYCLNNPVVLADSSGTAAHIGFSADGQIHDAPWRIGSPGGGGWSQDLHYSQQDYGTVADKFYTVMALQRIQSLNKRYMEIKAFHLQREEEFRHHQEAIYGELFIQKIQAYSSNPIVLIDDITGDVSAGLSVLAVYSHLGIVAISPAGQAVVTYVGAACTVWYLARKAYAGIEKLFMEVSKQ